MIFKYHTCPSKVQFWLFALGPFFPKDLQEIVMGDEVGVVIGHLKIWGSRLKVKPINLLGSVSNTLIQ